MKNKTITLLTVIFIISLLLAIKTSSEPPISLIEETWLSSLLSQFPTGNSLIFSIATGFLVSIIFYVLVVYIPESRKKKIIKHKLSEHYRFFKKSTISIFLLAMQGSYEAGEEDELLDQKKFKEYFKTEIEDRNTRWHSVINGLEGYLLKELLVELEILMNELSFVLSAVNIDNEEAYSFFKVLSHNVYKLKDTTEDYDEMKSLARFLWEIFAGYSFVEGYRKDDIIQKMINSL